MENKKATMTTVERINNIISSVKELRIDYTDVHSEVFHEYTGDYSNNMTKAIASDADWYCKKFMKSDKTLGRFISTWQERLCAYGDCLEQMGKDYSDDKKPVSFNKDEVDEMCEDVVAAIKLAQGQEGEPYESFLTLCVHFINRVTYIRIWEYMFEELWLMQEAIRNVPMDEELCKFVACRKELMHLMIMIRQPGDDHDFLVNELYESWKTLIRMVKVKIVENKMGE